MKTVDEIMALVDYYWTLAYTEGRESRTVDMNGEAQKTVSAIRTAIEALAQPAGEAEPVAWIYEELLSSGAYSPPF